MVPYRILRSSVGERGRICVTQPRRITLRATDNAPDDTTTPGFIARHLLRSVLPDGSLGIGPGHEIGFQYSGEYTQQDRYTKVLFVTDGTLIPWLESGRVGQFDVVFIDEAHEQSSNMELIFALLKYRLGLFPRLRVVIASATADVEKFRAYFGNGDPASVFLAAPDKAATATPFAIHDRWSEEWSRGVLPVAALTGTADIDARKRLLPEAIAATVRAICGTPDFTRLSDPRGDILAFVPTVATVAGAVGAVTEMARREGLKLQVFASHAQMSGRELREFKESEARAERAAREGRPTEPQRVIVATNYAETSVTIQNLRYVIDAGMILQPGWDAATSSQRYETTWHSQAGCTQRKGRVGRIAAGECFRLYTRTEHAAFVPHTPPEISRQPLDQFLLSAKAAGIEDLNSFRWLSRDDSTSERGSSGRSEFERSTRALGRRGTMDAQGDITARGLEFGGTRVPRVELAECLSAADEYACALEVATFLAFIGQPRGPFERGEAGALGYARWRTGCADDLDFYLRLYEHWRSRPERSRAEWAAAEGLNPDALAAVAASRIQLLAEFTRKGHGDPTDRALDLVRLHRVRLILAKCLLEWVYVKSATGGFEPFDPALCPCSRPVEIDQESACHASGPDAFVCTERVLARNDRLFARHLVRVNREWLPHLASASPLGLVAVMNAALEAERPAADATASVVRRQAAVDASGYAVGQLRDRLKVIRFIEGTGRRSVLLTEDTGTGQPVLVEKATDDLVEIGAELRAFVTEIDPGPPGRIAASQSRLLRWYQQRAGKEHDPIPVRLTSARTAEATRRLVAAHVRAEPGVAGFLDARDVDFATRTRLLQLPAGTQLRVNVKEARDGGGLFFVLPEVARARARVLQKGDPFPCGVVEGFDVKDGRRAAGDGLRRNPPRPERLPARAPDGTATEPGGHSAGHDGRPRDRR